jgi:hypothetical protein
MPYIDIEKDAGVFAHALIRAQWSRATGVKSCVEQASASEFQGDDPTGFMKSVLETGQFCGEFGFTGGDENILMPEQVSAVSVV